MIFNSPDRYGKGLDWTGYTVHDAANILRRYLNQLPEPIVPLNFYERFRDPLRAYQAKAGNNVPHQAMENREHAKAVHAYQALIKDLPPLNRQLLLYILDLLAVFASKSDLNRMTAENLAAIFQPGIISHPHHDMAPNEYRLSQDVLIFLIQNQDNFLIGMNGTAMDDKTKDEVKSGPPSIKTPKAAIGRSASTASAGTDSLRKAGGLRRGGSVSSRNSRDRSSPGVSSPGTPASPSNFPGSSGSSGGLGRSNTVPSNRSPAMTGHRFQRMSENSQPSTPVVNTPATIPGSPPDEHSTTDTQSPTTGPSTDVRVLNIQTTALENHQVSQSEASVVGTQESRPLQDSIIVTPVNGKQTRDRKISNLFPRSPIFGPSDQQLNQQQNKPRKLQKRRIPGSTNDSAQSSQASLNNGEEGGVFQTPLLTPNATNHERADPMESHSQTLPNAVATPTTEFSGTQYATSPPPRDTRNSRGLMPPNSPTLSMHSRGSITDPSDLDALDDPAVREEKKRNKFRLSSAWKGDEVPLAPPPPIGQNQGARTSNSSLGSNRPRKSFTGDSQLTQPSIADGSSAGHPPAYPMSSRESTDMLKEPHHEPVKKEGMLSKWKAKFTGYDRRDRDAERAKSPPRLHPDQSNSRNSLTAMTHEAFSPRGRSFDRPREDILPIVQEKPQAERIQAQYQPAPHPFQTPQPGSVQHQAQAPHPAHFGEPSLTSAPVSLTPKAVPTLSQQPHSYTAPIAASNVAPTTAPLVAAAPGPVPMLAPSPMPRAVSTNKESESIPTVAAHASTTVDPQMQGVSAINGPTTTTEHVPTEMTQPDTEAPKNLARNNGTSAPSAQPVAES